MSNDITYMKRTLSFLLFAIVACSCVINHQTKDVLDSVDSIIQEKPDSALRVLGSLSPDDLGTRELQARYSLLYATALDKNYIDTTDLSVIRPAFEYYSKHGTPVQKLKTFFYQGRIYANRGEDDRAMYYYLLALEDSSRVVDNHYKELVNSAISDIFSRNHNKEQELLYAIDALRYGRLAEDSVGVWAITGHIASCYGNLRRQEDAEKAYRDFFAMPIYDSLIYVKREISYAKDLLRKPEPEPAQCIEILERVANTTPKAMTTEAYCIYAYAQQLIGNCTIAKNIIEQLIPFSDNQDIVKLWRYRILREQGQYKQAIEDLEQSVLVQDSIVLSTLTQSLIRSQRDYLKAETEVLKKENRIDQQRLSLIIVTSILVIGLLFYLYSRRKASFTKRVEELSKLQIESQQMLDLQNARIALVKAQLEEKDAALLALRKHFASIYKAQFKTLNDLCAAYLSPIKKDRKEVLYDEAMRQLDIIVNDKDSQDKFMSMVNSSLDGIIDKLRKDLPAHKEHDIRFLMYIIAGFDATTISNLTGYSVGTVYTKKNRLKGEISRLSSSHKAFYLQFIE